MSILAQHKITPEHLGRKAVVYLRQSSPGQVKNNVESQRLQYDMAQHAQQLGWRNVESIDMDLGKSAGVGAAVRQGFEHLLTQVATHQVGIIFSRELSRLLRTDRDFCQLMEVCQLFDTLLGDSEQIYDLSLMDDQLVLGIKGTLSVVELRTMKLRLLQGQESKARRGELFRLLPPGYVLNPDGNNVVKDPDLRVQEMMALVFRKFGELWSLRQTMLWFHDNQVELPVNKVRGGQRRLAWQLPTYSFISDVLHNPLYAGAYVYGRRPREVTLIEGRPIKRQGRLRPPEQARVFIRDHHQGYISWAMYEENQQKISANALRTNSDGDEAAGAVRAGQGLLAGLLRCRRCGRKLHVRYWGKHGTAARYLCKGDYDCGGRYCLGFGGATVDRRLGEYIVEAISELGVAASLEAAKRLDSAEQERLAARRRQLEQAEYEALRAGEQYDEADPRNRLVAAELEQRWNAKLEVVQRCKAELAALSEQPKPLTAQEHQQLTEMGSHFGDVWHNDDCPMELKKKIARTVIEEVLVDLDEQSDRLQLVVHWKGGCHTSFEMEKPRSGVGRKTSQEDREIIARMAERGYGDDQIARVLTKLGRRTAKDKRYNQQRVATVRRTYKISGQKRARRDPDILTLAEAAKHSGVSDTTIARLVERGLLRNDQVVPWAPWEIRRSDLESEPVHGILEHLKQTGKLVLDPIKLDSQGTLFQ